MKAFLENPIVVALLTALIMWLAGWARTFLAKRVRVRSPEAAMLEQVVPAVNVLISTQGPVLDGVKTLLEVAQGTCNGNVEDALGKIRPACERFEKFRDDAAKVGA